MVIAVGIGNLVAAAGMLELLHDFPREVHHHDGITLTDITCRCNLVVIGACAGGLIVLAGSTEVGAKVALIEE